MGIGCAAVLFAGVPAFAQSKNIAIERLALHQFEDGPVLADSYQFVPGETVYFSCRLTGYSIEKKENLQQVKLAWQVHITDPAGVPVEKERTGRIEERVLPQDKNWMPKFLVNFSVPAFAPTGVFRVSVKITDELSSAETNGSINFRVRGHDVEPSQTLVARNFHFFRGENDSTELISPVYHPGEMLWARFDITGYKFAHNNRFSVDYGLAVLNANGAQLFAQPEAASQSEESFYPQRYVPGALSLNLDQSVAKGAYTLVVTIRDKIGDQMWEVRQPFQVE